MADNHRIWHIHTSNNESFGPYTSGELAQLLRTGRIQASASIWRDGWSNWQRVADVPDFGGMVPDGPAARRTPAPGAGDGSNGPSPARRWLGALQDSVNRRLQRRQPPKE